MFHVEYSAHVISLSELGAPVQKAETEPRAGAAQVGFQGVLKTLEVGKKIYKSVTMCCSLPICIFLFQERPD